MKEFLAWVEKQFSNMFGMIKALAEYTRTQRLFLYSVLVTLFFVGYFIVLPRYDCTQLKSMTACAYIEWSYERLLPKIEKSG